MKYNIGDAFEYKGHGFIWVVTGFDQKHRMYELTLVDDAGSTHYSEDELASAHHLTYIPNYTKRLELDKEVMELVK